MPETPLPTLKKIFIENTSKILFFTTLILVVLAGIVVYKKTNIYINQPVYYFADFAIFSCGDKQHELTAPKGLTESNGYQDRRNNFEGLGVEPKDVNLGNYFKVLGGWIDKYSFSFPSENGQLIFTENGSCDGQNPNKLQVFVYKVAGGKITQSKLEDPSIYTISPYPQVPPGDCIIIELDKIKDKTDKVCKSYSKALQQGKIYF